MKAIILAAGVGQRLGESSDNKPKCLLSFENKSLLQRHIEILNHYGVDDILIVTGFKTEAIQEKLKSIGADHVETTYNPDFTKGSILSLFAGLKMLTSNDDFLLMDADVLYDHKILGRLIQSGKENIFLLDQDFEMGDEPVKLCVKNESLVDFRKQIEPTLSFDYQGESVGFFKFTAELATLLNDKIQEYIDKDDLDAPYEEVIRDLLLKDSDKFSFEDITGLPWLEVDFPEDVAKAKNEIFPKLSAMND